MPVQRRHVVLDSLIEPFQPHEHGAAGPRRFQVLRLEGPGGAIVLQRPFVVAGVLERVAQVVVELGAPRADPYALAQHREALVLAPQGPQRHPEVGPARACLGMLLQDGPVGVHRGSESAVGMELNRALDSKTHVHDEDIKKGRPVTRWSALSFTFRKRATKPLPLRRVFRLDHEVGSLQFVGAELEIPISRMS